MENTTIDNPSSPKVLPPKKIVIIMMVVVVLIGGFFLYKYLVNNFSQSVKPVEREFNTNTNKPPEQKTEVQLPNNSIQAEGTNNKGTLTVCQDKCGDGICQKIDTACNGDALNCVCQETPQECPQDCK